MNKFFLNKIVVVTGGYRGNGLGIVKKFLSLGAKVYSLDDKHFIKISATKKLVKVKINLANFDEIKNFSNYILKKEKKIDYLINNAGISLNFKEKKIFEYWNKTISVNAASAFYLGYFMLPFLKKSKFAAIVNISSIASKIAMSKNQAYNASKAALNAITRSQALDFSKYKIRSNSICPGYIKTNMTLKSYNKKSLFNVRIKRMMIPNYGTSKNISDLVVFLCSRESEYINAQEIIIDGGLIKKGI